MKIKKIALLLLSAIIIGSMVPGDVLAVDNSNDLVNEENITEEPIIEEKEDMLNDEGEESSAVTQSISILEQEDLETISAYGENAENESEIASGQVNESIMWMLYSNGDLVINGIGDMPNYVEDSFSSPWYNYCENITNVIIEDGITSIGTCAFIGCVNLKSISIPENITTIGACAFKGCENLRNIWYGGSEESWEILNVDINNNVTVYYNYTSDHIHSYRVNKIVDSTCTENGIKEEICELCGEIFEEEIPVKGHDFSEWKTISQATVFTKAKQERKCKICNYKETRNIGNKLKATMKVSASKITIKPQQKITTLKVTFSKGKKKSTKKRPDYIIQSQIIPAEILGINKHIPLYTQYHQRRL